VLQKELTDMTKELKTLPMAEESVPTCCPDVKTLPSAIDAADAGWVTGEIKTAAGPVYRVSTSRTVNDIIGTVKTRLNLGRMNYLIKPALYAVGNPDDKSPVLVSANYKLSFDSLRFELTGLNLWILVIDTKGINVWCAAGKGTFGTAEVVRMVEATGLANTVSHRTLILPQLAAPGVSAHEVKRLSGFKVNYGPVRAADIPAFLASGNRADAAMRRTRFNLADRMVLAPVELVGMIVPTAILAASLFIINLVAALAGGSAVSLALLLNRSLSDLAPFLAAMLIGIILVPALLPYIPGRALAWKGWVLGLLWAMVFTTYIAPGAGWLQIAAYYLTLPAIPAFLGMNFTGSTTYTSLSGVVKEMNYALPMIIASSALGLIALVTAYFI
jgi:hypothetical protein